MERSIPSQFELQKTVCSTESYSLAKAVNEHGDELFIWNADTLDQASLESARNFHHPNVAPVTEWGAHENGFYAVQPALAKANLHATGNLEAVPVVLSKAAQIALGLKAIHRSGLVLGNLQLPHCVVSDNGRIQVLGLGIGTSASAPRYSAPELHEHSAVATSTTDVFAFGALVFELLVGLAAFDGEHDSLQRAISYQPPPRLGSLRPEIPRAVELIITKCLAKRPEDRFSTMDDVADELLRTSYTPSSRRRSKTWLPAVAGALFLVGVGYVLGTVFSAGDETVSPQTEAGRIEQWRTIAIMPLRYGRIEDITPNESTAGGNRAARTAAEERDDEENNSALARAVEDGIVSAVTRNTPLTVISTLSTRAYQDSLKGARQIAVELGADALLEASIIQDRGLTLLHIRCADASTGTYAWNQTLRLESEDIFRIQNQVEATLYSELRPIWTALEKSLATKSREAYTLFLESKTLYSETDLESTLKAIDQLKRAVTLDENFALAWAALARAYSYTLPELPSDAAEKAFEDALVAADRAIELAPNAPDGYGARGRVEIARRFYHGRESDEAEYWVDEALKRSQDFREALLDKAFIMVNRGLASGDGALLRDSLEYFARTLGQHPTDTHALSSYATVRMLVGEQQEGLAQLARAVENTPDSIPLQTSLSHVAYAAADYDRAIEATTRLLELDPMNKQVHELRLANYLTAINQRADALAIATKYLGSRRPGYMSFLLASTYAGLGEDEEALRLLDEWDEATPRNSGQRFQFDWWLRNDPNFQKLFNQDQLSSFFSA